MKNIDNDNYLTKMSANFSRYCCVKPRRRKKLLHITGVTETLLKLRYQ